MIITYMMFSMCFLSLVRYFCERGRMFAGHSAWSQSPKNRKYIEIRRLLVLLFRGIPLKITVCFILGDKYLYRVVQKKTSVYLFRSCTRHTALLVMLFPYNIWDILVNTSVKYLDLYSFYTAIAEVQS